MSLTLDFMKRRYDGHPVNNFERMLCHLMDKCEEKDVRSVDIYLWVHCDSSDQGCLKINLNRPGVKDIRVCDDQISSDIVKLKGVTSLVLDDRGGLGVYNGLYLIASTRGPFDLRAEVMHDDDRREYLKMEDWKDES